MTAELEQAEQERDRLALIFAETFLEAQELHARRQAMKNRFGEAMQTAINANRRVKELGGNGLSMPMCVGWGGQGYTAIPEVKALAKKLRASLKGEA